MHRVGQKNWGHFVRFQGGNEMTSRFAVFCVDLWSIFLKLQAVKQSGLAFWATFIHR